MNPLVSVIIPTYGGESTIIRSVKSVLEQTYDNFEIIVVDDNNPGTDARNRTEQYMSSFDENNKVNYVKHSKNKNGAAARNTGVRHSSGKYICLLDDDDIFYKDKIQEQVTFLEMHPEFDGCYCWRKQNGRIIGSEEEGDLTKSLLDLSFTPMTDALMIRRECYLSLDGFDESYIRHQDFEFMLRFYKKYKMGVVKKVLFEAIGNGVNNQPYGQKLYDVKELFFKQFGEEVEQINKKYPGYRKKVYAEHFSRAFKDMIRHGNFKLALKIYGKYGYKGGMEFWKIFFKCCFGGMKERISIRGN